LGRTKILDSNIKNTYGFFVVYKNSEKRFIELQLKRLDVVYQSRQDSVGKPILPSFVGLNISLNTSLLYGYFLNNYINISGGLYHNLLIFYIANDINVPILALNLKNNPNIVGGTAKISYIPNRLSLECGIYYPFNATTESYSTLYYFPILFGQLKYRISKRR